MKVVIHSTARTRGAFPFGVSGCVHGGVLAWLIVAGTGGPRERALSIYEREIRPHEDRIVWYSLRV